MPNIEDDERELDNGEVEDGSEDAEVEGSEEGQEDAADEEGGDEAEDVLAAEAERKPTRGERRFQALSTTAREASERASKAEREAQELRQRLDRLEQRPTQQESPETEAARLALMTPEERLEYRLDKAQKDTAGKLARMEFISLDQADRAEFLAKAASDPRLAKIADKVEARLADIRSKGQNVNRAALATFLIGEMALAASTKAVQKQKAAAGKRVASQTTQPANGRGDVGATRRKTGSTPEDRLDGVSI